MSKLASHIAIFSLTAALPTTLMAFSFDEAKAYSHVGAPLDVVIPINGVNDDSNPIQFRIADEALFSELGVDRAFIHQQLKISYTREQQTLHISTDSNYNEPYLEFVVEARWPVGTVAKTVTILLDPPIGADQASNTSATQLPTTATTTAKSPRSSVVTSPRPNLPSPKASSPANVASGSRYTTRSGDNLSKIASRITDRSASLSVAMQAILDQNPGAFVNGDPNRLKSGYALNIPSHIGGALSQETAKQEVIAETAAKPAPKVTPQQTQASTPKTPTAAIKPATASQDSRVADLTQRIEASEQATQATRDKITSNRQRLARLQETMTELQEQYKQIQTASTETQAPVLAKQSQSVAQTEPNQPTAEEKSTPQPTSPLSNSVFSYAPWLAAVLLFILGAFFYAIYRKAQRSSAPEDNETLAQVTDSEITTLYPQQSESGAHSEADVLASIIEEESIREQEEKAAIANDLKAQSDGEEDPILTSSVYRAYGRIEEAKNLLVKAIEKDPSREDAKILLAEMYLELEQQEQCKAILEELEQSSNAHIHEEISRLTELSNRKRAS